MFNLFRKTQKAVQNIRETVFDELLKDDIVIFVREGAPRAEIVERVTGATVYTTAQSSRGFWYDFARPIERVDFVYRGVEYDAVLAAIEEDSNCHQN